MVDRLPLPIQTLYAELVDRCSLADFDAAFPPNGSFVRVPVRGRDYWYFQEGRRNPESGRQARKYVGPDSPELTARIAAHGKLKSAYSERRQIVAALRRAGLATPSDQTGALLAALSAAGVFRLRASVIGTVAYQNYAGMLGIRLPEASTHTQDLDLAQFRTISVAVSEDEAIPALIDLLRGVDPTFSALPYAHDSRLVSAYVNESGYRVEAMTPNRGAAADRPQRLPSLGTYAMPLRFLDFLIHESTTAAVLHDGGVLINVPPPERYALHKLIVARLRPAGNPKIDKDLRQAEILLDVLAERRAPDLREAWTEATARGPKWRKHLLAGLEQLSPAMQERVRDVLRPSEKP